MIAVVDDDESIRNSLTTLLRAAGYCVTTFASAGDWLLDARTLKETRCLILDIKMPGIDGLELQRRLNAANSQVPIIFITAFASELRRQKVVAAGAVDLLCKPFEARALLAAVRTALRQGA